MERGDLVLFFTQDGELKQWSDPHIRAIVRGEPFKAESETGDLWKPK